MPSSPRHCGRTATASRPQHGHIEWMQPAVAAQIRETAAERIAVIRREFHAVGSRLRQAEALARGLLPYTFEMFLEFAAESGVSVDAARADELSGIARDTLRGPDGAYGVTATCAFTASGVPGVPGLSDRGAARDGLARKRIRLLYSRAYTPGSTP